MSEFQSCKNQNFLSRLSVWQMALDLETPSRYYGTAVSESTSPETKAPSADEDEIDLFADDDAADAGASIREVMAAKKEAAKAEAEKKKKKVVIAKSSVTLHAMPYDGEVDITGIYETMIKKIEIDGLVWGVPCTVVNGPFGLKGLQFGCVVEDDKVKTDDIEEAIEILGLSKEDADKYVAMRRDGSLDDYEDEWPGKLVGTVKVVSFQKI
eukprot:Blabericola_migrator_1__6604@NODE_332_length_9696_cov_191_326202_g268_i0_p5_GENE_NODE_332_length_9696_cov_191_326202_g268_i0NODE_332_length_9696_cov_191_326202_g268_i0_p5_ORF_typecomplete_len211_score64_29EF1_GNE/PF00736_19/6_3e03EF1_GNE/PF00736_19/6_7e17DUF739/PF05339_11/0_26DUF3967/PF13152_6/12_NODE_332_length_9696_cov_191_326202_g268_i09751607